MRNNVEFIRFKGPTLVKIKVYCKWVRSNFPLIFLLDFIVSKPSSA